MAIEPMDRTAQAEAESVITVSASELQEFGCAHCGFRSGTAPISYRNTTIWRCGECGRATCVLSGGIQKSQLGICGIYPELQPHPRRGMPAHGRDDEKPEKGGEYFWPRGIGADVTPGCFVCGGENALRANIAAFVQCKESGERIIAMFKHGARVDFREYEPDRVQVKIGACQEHQENLQELFRQTRGGIITQIQVALAAGLKPVQESPQPQA